jgi:2-dehydropantoate 2-reductase
VVEIPADYITPGEVTCFFSPILGVLHVGRHGIGDTVPRDMLVSALNDAGFAAFAQDDIAGLRYAKLFLNLGNAIGAVIADRKLAEPYVDAARGGGEGGLCAGRDRAGRHQEAINGGVKPADRRRAGRQAHGLVLGAVSCCAAPDRSRPTTSTARSC